MFIRLFSAFILAIAFAAGGPARAQDTTRSILVLDASGSMWGQIDGTAKIEIARDVIGRLLNDLPATTELGLTVYGHRRKGDCSDIETLIAPGGDRRAEIAAAINGIKPRGKTPLSAAVIAAAEALKYTEDKATVILISDGKETCDFDPCEVGRTLESNGVDFTAHVIGFDVADPKDIAQLQCLAEETGGTFRSAANASELTEALAVVAEPDPTFGVSFAATEGAGGPVVTQGLTWDIGQSETGPWLAEGLATATPGFTDLPGGPLFAHVRRAKDGAEATLALTLDKTTISPVFLVLPELPPEPVSLTGIAVEQGSNQQITDGLVWSLFGPDGKAIAEFQAGPDVTAEVLPGTYRVEVLRTEDEATAEANVQTGETDKLVRLILPEIARPAQLRLIAREKGTRKTIQRDLVWTVLDRDGNPVLEELDGNDIRTEVTPGRYTAKVLRPDDGKEASLEFAALKKGTTVTVDLPDFAPGATITAPQTAPAGAEILIDWTGPGEANDYIAVSVPEDGDGKYVNYTYTREGPTLPLVMPPEPGTYELRYVLNSNRTALARKTIEITPVEVALDAPEQAAAGAKIKVDWTGPDYGNDYIDVAVPGAANNKYINYSYTRDGSPLELLMPVEPGTYELRYVMSQGRTVLATRKIEVAGITFGVSGPAQAVAGDTIKVEWVGGDYQNDYIAVSEVGSRNNQYASYTYTREGSPLDLRLPLKPGDYELRYVVAQDRTVTATAPLEITPVTATVSAPSTIGAGDQLVVEWTGPAYQADFLAISETGSRQDKYLTYSYARDGSPLEVQVPSQPGTYELRYIAVGPEGRKMLASASLTVTDVTASLDAPDTVSPKGEVQVTWQGPGYRNDYVAIAQKGDPKGYVAYRYTRDGNPAFIRVPDTPGDYELRYFMGQDRRILARRDIKVE